MSQNRRRGRARIIDQKEAARGYREMRLEYSGGDGNGSNAGDGTSTSTGNSNNSKFDTGKNSGDGSNPDTGNDSGNCPGGPVDLPRPGQFFTILPESHPMQVMRHPFAYSAADASGFSFIYEIRGRATSDLAGLANGAEVDWIGPLGTGFPEAPAERRPVLVAGGIGVGPMAYLAAALSDSGREPLLVLGARTADLVPDLNLPAGVEMRICTDDGTRGIRGTALTALTPDDLAGAACFACGPIPMMKALHEASVEAGSPCHVSMEEMMACGVGACQGCAVEMAHRDAAGGPTYKRACEEGPVFDSRELAW